MTQPVRNLWLFLILLWFGLNESHAATTCVQDDLNQPVCVKQAQRILVLAPHLTEIVDFVGGLDRVIAVDGSSNFPVAVDSLPKLPNPWVLGVESILARKPDLVLVWQSGISADVVVQLRKAGMPVFVSEPKTIAQVAITMQRIALLLGTQGTTNPRVDQWLARFETLRTRFKGRSVVPVFYQVWRQPLMTLGGQHVVSEVIGLCGGRNVFSDLTNLAAQVSVEGVLKRNPAMLLSSGSLEDHRALLKQWAPWPGLNAVQRGHVYTVPNDLLVRNGPRLIDAAEQVCDYIEQARGQ